LLLCTAALARETQAPVREQLERPGRCPRFTLGDPFGLSIKRYLRGANAIDFNLALAYGPGVRFGVDWPLGPGHRAAPKFDIDVYMGWGPSSDPSGGRAARCSSPTACNGDVYVGGRVPFGRRSCSRKRR